MATTPKPVKVKPADTSASSPSSKKPTPEPAPLTPTSVQPANIKPAHDTPPKDFNTMGKITPQTAPAPRGLMSQLWDDYLARRERILAEQKQNPGQVVGELAQILITRGRTIKGGAGVKPPNTVPQTAAPKPVTAPAPKAGQPAATPAAPTTAAPAQGKGGGYSTGAKKVKRKPKRRCELVPYNELECEKGQEAHHVIPDWMLRMGKRGGSERIPDMPSLAEGPAICLEGGSGNEHNTAHKHTDRPAQRVGKNGKSTGVAGTITLGQGKAISSRAIEKATGGKKGGGCSRKDIQKQLDEQFTAQNDAILRGVKDSRKVTDSIKDALNGGKD